MVAHAQLRAHVHTLQPWTAEQKHKLSATIESACATRLHPLHHRAVRTCNTCFLKNVAWDATRTHDVLGPADGTLVVLVHGALVGRQCLVLEARALAEAGFRCVRQVVAQ